MLKRIFWLALIVLGGWLLWSLWRQRQEIYHAPSPQFAPIAPAPSTAPVVSAPPVAVPVPTPPPAARSDMNGVAAPAEPQAESLAGDQPRARR